MEILLEEFYKTDLHLEKFIDRKIFIENKSYQIIGITKSGKSYLVKNYLLTLKKNNYLYINCDDIRIDVGKLNAILTSFCNLNNITTLVLDNYTKDIKLINIGQIIITSQIDYNIKTLDRVKVYPLDYEEFLAYEHKHDSTALNHFFQLGGFAFMHKISADERNIYIQQILKNGLNDIEFDVLVLCSKFMSQKLSAFAIYERLKKSRKISKDVLYKSFDNLEKKDYIHLLEKFNHSHATKKVYLCDIALKSALCVEKNFSTLFENMIFLELLKSKMNSFYDENIDFYLPQKDEIILCKPFVDERRLFKKLENIEEFIITHSIKKITIITMNKEGSISHPFSKIEIIPFDIWALGD